MIYKKHWTYDNLPKEIFGSDILEIGVHTGKNQLASKYSHYFLSPGYLGIDPVVINSDLNVIGMDIRDFKSKRKFDLILSVDSMCYIPYPDWKPLFLKMKSLLKLNGYFVIIVDYKRGTDNTFRMRVNEDNIKYPHAFMNITKQCFTNILPFELTLIRDWLFRTEGEPFGRSTIRFIYRLLTHHPNVPRTKILAIWKNIGD
jgi:hypothetical protein